MIGDARSISLRLGPSQLSTSGFTSRTMRPEKLCLALVASLADSAVNHTKGVLRRSPAFDVGASRVLPAVYVEDPPKRSPPQAELEARERLHVVLRHDQLVGIA